MTSVTSLDTAHKSYRPCFWWNIDSNLVSRSLLPMWCFQHQHAKPVNKEFKSSFPAAKLFCFGRLRNVPVSTLKLVPFKRSPALCGASVAVEYFLTVRTPVHCICLWQLHFPQLHTVCYYIFIVQNWSFHVILKKLPLTAWLLNSLCLSYWLQGNIINRHFLWKLLNATTTVEGNGSNNIIVINSILLSVPLLNLIDI